MSCVLMVSDKNRAVQELKSILEERGFFCALADTEGDILGRIAEEAPDVVLLEINFGIKPSQLKQEKPLPVIGMVAQDQVNGSLYSGFDDIILEPYSADELILRINRLINRNSGELIKAGDLVIDLARCEASVGGRVILLTFKEYELLKFLATNRGRVFTREALLDKVWGYDYFGGDRTVDVHVRRLRSKIEDHQCTFIETVRNVGYRFRKDI